MTVLIIGVLSNSCMYKNDTLLRKYIRNKCDFSTDKTCVINFCDIYHIQSDTVYLFDGYSSPEYESIFIHKRDVPLSHDFIFGNEDQLLVLTKNGEIKEKIRIPHQYYFFDMPQTISQRVFFDNDSILIYAKMYPKVIFSVEKKSDGTYQIY